MQYLSRLVVAALVLFSTAMVMPTVCMAVSGDVDENGTINVFDALMTLQYAVNLYQPPDDASFKLMADVAPLDVGTPTGNGTVDVFDALAILRHSVGLDLWNVKAVTLETSLGTITITLFPEKAPITVKNFLTYVQDGFYDGLIFHRVIKNFMIQGGGLTAELIQKPTRPPIVNEAGNGLSNRRGTVAMARTAAVNSATAQFFINTVDNLPLDHKDDTANGFGYAVFGEVTGGMDVVDAISAVPTASYYVPATGLTYKDVPVEPVITVSAKFAR